jgi:hypothetical protein
MAVWGPTDKVEVVQVAVPVPGTKPSPPPVQVMGVPPSVKATVPVSAMEPLNGVTVAVNVTAWLVLEGFGEPTRATAVLALFTVCEIDCVLPPKLVALPEYVATMVCGDPAAVRLGSLQTAVPVDAFVTVTAIPVQAVIGTVLSVNETVVPTGNVVGAGESVTVAVNCTD